MSSSAFVAHSAVWVPDEAIVSRVKLASLLFDKVMLSKPDSLDKFAEVTVGVQREPQLTETQLRELSSASGVVPDGAPAFSIYGSESQPIWEEPRTKLDLAITEAILSLGGSPREHYDHYKWSLYTKSEILYWRSYLPEAAFVGSEASELALHKYAGKLLESERRAEVAAPCPEVSALPWKDIVDLRRSPFLVSFRSKYFELLAAHKTHELMEHYQIGLERLADEVRPSTSRAAVWAVLSNLPIPVVNPFHVGHSAYEVWHQAHLEKEFGWLFFIRRAKSLAAEVGDVDG